MVSCVSLIWLLGTGVDEKNPGVGVETGDSEPIGVSVTAPRNRDDNSAWLGVDMKFG